VLEIRFELNTSAATLGLQTSKCSREGWTVKMPCWQICHTSDETLEQQAELVVTESYVGCSLIGNLGLHGADCGAEPGVGQFSREFPI
jgi:hypothetical protein